MSRIEKVKKLDKMYRHSKERKSSMGGETTHNQTHGDMWMNMFLQDTSCDTLSHAVHVNKDGMCTNVRENPRCEGVLFTHTVGYSGSLSTVNETNCDKKERFKQKNCELTSNSIRMRTNKRNLEMKANIAILYVGQLERWTSNLRR